MNAEFRSSPDIGIEVVANDEHLLFGRVADLVKSVLKKGGVGLGVANLIGDDNGLKIRLQSGLGDPWALHFLQAVGHQRQPVLLRQPLHLFHGALDQKTAFCQML